MRFINICLCRIKSLGRLDSWRITWSDVEELRYEIDQYNLNVKLRENFNTLERQDAFDHQDVILEGQEYIA